MEDGDQQEPGANPEDKGDGSDESSQGSDGLEFKDDRPGESGADSQEEDSEDGHTVESNKTVGPSTSRQGWRKVNRRTRSHDNGSEGSEDVEHLLDDYDSDGSKYFKKWFDENKVEEPDPEPESELEGVGPNTPRRTSRRRLKKSKQHGKRDWKGKQPIRPQGYDQFLLSISQAG